MVGDVKLAKELMRSGSEESCLMARTRIAREIYEDFLFHFEKAHNEETQFRLKDFKKHHVKLQDVDPSLLKEVHVIRL